MGVCNCTLAGTKACDTCLNNDNKISKGYYEFTPFVIPNHNGLKGLMNPSEITDNQIKKDDELKDKIFELIYDKPIHYDECMKMTDEIFELIKAWKNR